MKKITALFLSFALVFMSLVPAYAAEPTVSFDPATQNTDKFLQNIVEEGLVVTDENGNVIPKAYYEKWEFSENKPAPGTYNVGGNTQRVNVALNQQILTVAVSELTGYVLEACFGIYSGGVPDVVAAVMEGYFARMREKMPETETLYVEKTLWSNGNPDTSSTPMKYYYKIRTTYYEDSRFTNVHGSAECYGTLYITNH